MRESSNPVMRGVVRDNQPAPYAGFNQAIPGAQQAAYQAGQQQNPYLQDQGFAPAPATGPASARLLADLILGREPITDPAPYALTAAR